MNWSWLIVAALLVVLLVAAGCGGCTPTPPPAAGQAGSGVAAAAPPDGAGMEKRPSGLQIKHIRVGTGASPAATDQVEVHYEGCFADGRVFDSSYRRGQPAVFPVNRVIAGWTEALQLMKEGGECRLCIPPDLAYGEMGMPPAIPPNATLYFKVELLKVLK